MIEEDVSEGQKVGSHRIVDARSRQVLSEGHTVGVRRHHPFPRIRTSEVVIETDREDDAIIQVAGYTLELDELPGLEEQPAFPSDRIDRADHVG